MSYGGGTFTSAVGLLIGSVCGRIAVKAMCGEPIGMDLRAHNMASDPHAMIGCKADVTSHGHGGKLRSGMVI